MKTTSTPFTAPSTSVDVMVAYAAKDAGDFPALETHLTVLKNQGIIRLSSPRSLLPGDPSEEKLRSFFDSASILVMLLTADTFSDKSLAAHLVSILQRHDSGKLHLVPVRLRVATVPPQWDRLHMLPANGQAILGLDGANRDKAWTEVTEYVRELAGKIRVERAVSNGDDERINVLDGRQIRVTLKSPRALLILQALTLALLACVAIQLWQNHQQAAELERWNKTNERWNKTKYTLDYFNPAADLGRARAEMDETLKSELYDVRYDNPGSSDTVPFDPAEATKIWNNDRARNKVRAYLTPKLHKISALA
jgi:hypothetical protein